MMSNDQLLKLKAIRNATRSCLSLRGYDGILVQVVKVADSVLREEEMRRRRFPSSRRPKNLDMR